MSTDRTIKDDTITTAGGVTLEFFPEELIQLRLEINHHPDLLVILHAQSDKDVYMQIAEIAAFCNLLLSGDYSRADIVEVCGKCLEVLRSKRIAYLN